MTTTSNRARRLSHRPGHRLLRAAALILVGASVSACSGDTTGAFCPNLPIANGVLGQSDYRSGTSNAGGISARTVSGPFGSIATNGQLTYLADTGNNRILGYNGSPDGIGAAANFELGQGDATGTDFTGRAAGVGPTSLSAPSKVTVSSDGRLVVTDTGNNRVLIWNVLPTANTPPDIVVGQPDLYGFYANQRLSAPTAATLNAPTAAAIANGNLVVADRGNNRVLIWSPVPTANNLPASVELGQVATRTADGSTTSCDSNGGPNSFCFGTALAAGDLAASGDSASPVLGLSAPSDVWTDGYKLLVSDSGNNRVLYWQQIPFANNTFYTYVIGQAQPAENAAGSDSQHLNSPWGVYSDGATIFVGDSGNNRVLLFSGFPVQSGPTAFGIFGQADFAHVAANDSDQNGAPGSQQDKQSDLRPAFNTLYFPTGVYASALGELYVADYGNHRIMMFPVSSAVNGTVPNSCNGVNPRVN